MSPEDNPYCILLFLREHDNPITVGEMALKERLFAHPALRRKDAENRGLEELEGTEEISVGGAVTVCMEPHGDCTSDMPRAGTAKNAPSALPRNPKILRCNQKQRQQQ
jgi:hypothetical protein